LDAEGAFDALPHEILFAKAMDVIPDHCWAMLVSWYRKITVKIKWGTQLGSSIMIEKGTRQGGLSSPFLFNLIYQDLVNELSLCIGGISIGSMSFNAFNYADDILLASLTVTRLQRLIDVAQRYISDHGLLFNPSKTICSVFGKCTLEPTPVFILMVLILMN
jgi:hypothetical protein